MTLADRFLGALGLQRSVAFPTMPWDGGSWYSQMLNSGFFVPRTTYNNKQEVVDAGFAGLAFGAFAANPIVFACMQARLDLFSEARFTFQRMPNGVPGELTNTPRSYLRLIEEPWPGGTTAELLKESLIFADLGSNAFIVREANGLRNLRPDWVTMIAGNPRTDATIWDLDTQLLGIGYQPGGPSGGKDLVYLQRREFAHFKSTNSPTQRFSGMSWLLPVLKDLTSDQAATAHKLNYFENAATPNMLVKFPETMLKAQADDWQKMFTEKHEGSKNAYRTLFLGGGSDAEVVGSSLRQSAYTEVQGAGELRIASASGVPPIMIGLSGGLDAATYSNYGQARRAFADLKMRSLWRGMAGALASITTVPADTRLWYDDNDISFLQEDVKDAAEIQSTQAAAMRQLIDAGYEPDSVTAAIVSGDMSRLKHTGFPSVQLQPSGATSADPATLTPVPDKTKPAALLNSARAQLMESGVRRPTQAQLAEHLGVSDRTLRRWESSAAE